MNPKKILFLIGSLGGGGAEGVLVTLVNGLCKNKNLDITVLTLYPGGINEQKLDKRISLKTVHLTRKYPYLNRWLQFFKIKSFAVLPSWLLHKIFIKEKYDVEIAFIEGLPTKIIAGASKATPIYAWIHINLLLFNYSKHAYMTLKHEQQAYRRFNKVFCVSNDVKEAFSKKFNLPGMVLYNPINQEELIAKSKEGIDSPASDASVLKLVTVGRLAKQKGFERLLGVVGKLRDQGYRFRLQIIGQGPEKDNLHQLFHQLQLEQTVDFVGYKINPYPYVKQADLFVCSSITEGFSTAVCEAILLDVPVLTTDCTGMREIFGDVHCGIIVENSEEGLYQGLKQLLDHPQQIIAMKQNCKLRYPFFAISHTIKVVEQELAL